MDRQEFEKLVAESLDTLPQEFAEKLENVAIVVEEFPTFEQLKKLRLRPHTLLFGLYEGVSLIGRTSTYASSLPDRITIFKNPILAVSTDYENARENVKSTVMHEIAHHFGMNEEKVRKLEAERKKNEALSN